MKTMILNLRRTLFFRLLLWICLVQDALRRIRSVSKNYVTKDGNIF